MGTNKYNLGCHSDIGASDSKLTCFICTSVSLYLILKVSNLIVLKIVRHWDGESAYG